MRDRNTSSFTGNRQEYDYSNTMNGLRIQQTATQNHRTSFKFKYKYVTILLSILCEVLLILTLCSKKWFYLNGGGCNRSYLNLALFLNLNNKIETSIEKSKVSKYTDLVVYTYDGLVNCINFNTLWIMRLLIVLIFVLIFTTFLLVLIDLFEDYVKIFRISRKYFILHILNIILCLVINGISFILTERLYEQQYNTRFKKGKRIEVKFDLCYYLIVILSQIYIIEILVLFLFNSNKTLSSYYTNWNTTNPDNDLLLNMQRSQPLQLTNFNESPPAYSSSLDSAQHRQQASLAPGNNNNTDTEPLLLT